MTLAAVVAAGSAGVWQIAAGNDTAPQRADSESTSNAMGSPQSDPTLFGDPVPATLTADGRVVLAPRFRILDRITDPVTGTTHSVALELRSDSQHLFFVTSRGRDGDSDSVWSDAGELHVHLAPWVADQRRLYDPTQNTAVGFAIREGKLVSTRSDTPWSSCMSRGHGLRTTATPMPTYGGSLSDHTSTKPADRGDPSAGEETAVELGISEVTVKSHTSRAVLALRGALTPEPAEPGQG